MARSGSSHRTVKASPTPVVWPTINGRECRPPEKTQTEGPASFQEADDEPNLPTAPADVLRYMQEHGTVIPSPPSDAQTPKAASFFLSDITGTAIAEIGTHVCMFTSVWGNWSSGTGNVTNLYLAVNSAGQWIADGARLGQVVCTSWSNFVGPSGSVKWLSEAISAQRLADGTSVANLWLGDSASFITGLGGEFEGGGESVHINFSPVATSTNKLNVRTQAATSVSGTNIWGVARSAFVGIPGSGRLVKLWGYNTNGVLVRGDAASAGTFQFVVGEPNGFSAFWMANFNVAVCFLTRFSGDFDNNNDKVTITQNGSQWFLSQNGEGIAHARCMAYDQR